MSVENLYYGRPLEAHQGEKERGVEVFWSDMAPQQWYPGGFPDGTGTWEVDKAKYPNGLKPLGDAIRAAGMGYLLWFEPERVHPGTKIDREHSEWVMAKQDEWSQLFRLHDVEARRWLTDCIDAHVTAAQLTWVRWDFNIEPLGFWRRNDPPDRQGITEIRHLEGLYAMWEELQRRLQAYSSTTAVAVAGALLSRPGGTVFPFGTATCSAREATRHRISCRTAHSTAGRPCTAVRTLASNLPTVSAVP